MVGLPKALTPMKRTIRAGLPAVNAILAIERSLELLIIGRTKGLAALRPNFEPAALKKVVAT